MNLTFASLFSNTVVSQKRILKEHNHVFAHPQEFDFWTGDQEFKDGKIDIELSQIRLHRPQSTLALPYNFSESTTSDTRFS